MFKKSAIFLIGLSLFCVFVFFSYLVHKDLFTQFDFDTTIKLQNHLSRRLDEFFSFLSLIGRFEMMSVFLLALIIIRRRIWGILLFLLYGGIHVFELFGKTFVDHLPPPHFMLRTQTIGDFPQFYVRSEYSYPSGHAARAAFISIIMAFMLARSKKLRPVHKFIIISFVLLYDLLMFMSRAYLGEHWMSDVIGGAILGASLGILGLVVL